MTVTQHCTTVIRHTCLNIPCALRSINCYAIAASVSQLPWQPHMPMQLNPSDDIIYKFPSSRKEISLSAARHRLAGVNKVFSAIGQHLLIFVIVVAAVMFRDGPLTSSVLFPAMVLLGVVRTAIIIKMSRAFHVIGDLSTTIARLQVYNNNYNHK